jgi:hypothetical protein
MAKTLKPAQVLAMSKGPKSKLSSSAVHSAAQALGRLGGYEGGPARAAKLSLKQLSWSGHHAACQRWGVHCKPGCPHC